MSGKPGVTSKVALMLVREFLSGLKMFPVRPEGESLLARTVETAALSVDHARAFLSKFDDECPSPREIKDVAWTLREQFLPPERPQEEIWKEEGYTYDAGFYEQVSRQLASVRKPGQPTMDEEMWRGIRRRLGTSDFSKIPFGKCWAVAQELGFPLNRYQREEMVRWQATQGGKETPPPAPEKRAIMGNTITWEDVQKVQREREEAKRNLEQIDGGIVNPPEGDV